MSNGIELTLTDTIAVVTLDRPDRGNSLDLPTARLLHDAALRCDTDDAIRAVVLTGRGKLFCGGGDSRYFPALGALRHQHLSETVGLINATVSRFLRMAKPLVVAVNGPAAGAGLGLALCGDAVIAAPNAAFATAYSALGISPDGGVSWLLPRLIGYRQAQALFYSSRRVGADEALALGLIGQIAPAESLMQVALDQARALAAIPPGAMLDTRRLLLASLSNTLETHLDDEARAMLANARIANGD